MPNTVRSSGLTQVDLLFAIGLCGAFVTAALLVVPSGPHSHRLGNQVVCAMNMDAIYKSLVMYSIMYEDRFPIAGPSDVDLPATGFREGSRWWNDLNAPRPQDTGAQLTNNISASLWLTVRSGYASTKYFICPPSINVEDPLTTTSSSRIPAPLAHTFDFLSADNLSYSPINMYHAGARMNWGLSVAPQYVLMGDAHSADWVDPTDGLSERVRTGDDDWGQNVLFGDGHTEYIDSPGVGVEGDDVYTMVSQGRPAPVGLRLDTGDAAKDDAVAARDSALVPLRGAGGLSDAPASMPAHTTRMSDEERRRMHLAIAMPASVCAVLLSMYLLKWRERWHRTAANKESGTAA